MEFRFLIIVLILLQSCHATPTKTNNVTQPIEEAKGRSPNTIFRYLQINVIHSNLYNVCYINKKEFTLEVAVQ